MKEKHDKIIDLMEELKYLYQRYEFVKNDAAGLVTMEALISEKESMLKELL